MRYDPIRWHDTGLFHWLMIADRIHLGQWTLSWIIIYSDITTEQALDTGVHIIRSRVYPGHFHNPILIIGFKVRYFGLCSAMYVYSCCDTLIHP